MNFSVKPAGKYLGWSPGRQERAWYLSLDTVIQLRNQVSHACARPE